MAGRSSRWSWRTALYRSRGWSPRGYLALIPPRRREILFGIACLAPLLISPYLLRVPLNRTELGAQVECTCAVNRSNFERGGGRNSCQNKGLQFPMRSEAGPKFSPTRMIGAERYQVGAASVIESFYFFQLGLQNTSELFVV